MESTKTDKSTKVQQSSRTILKELPSSRQESTQKIRSSKSKFLSDFKKRAIGSNEDTFQG